MKKIKKHIVSQEEIKHDPSLRWHKYQYGETIQLVKDQTPVRFVRYEGDLVRLADMVLRELPELVDPFDVRRIDYGRNTDITHEEMKAILGARTAMREAKYVS